MTAKPSDTPEHFGSERCGFDRNGSHSAGTYVCTCGWPFSAAQQPASAEDQKAAAAQATLGVPASGVANTLNATAPAAAPDELSEEVVRAIKDFARLSSGAIEEDIYRDVAGIARLAIRCARERDLKRLAVCRQQGKRLRNMLYQWGHPDFSIHEFRKGCIEIAAEIEKGE